MSRGRCRVAVFPRSPHLCSVQASFCCIGDEEGGAGRAEGVLTLEVN